jgi:hypothetical protein
MIEEQSIGTVVKLAPTELAHRYQETLLTIELPMILDDRRTASPTRQADEMSLALVISAGTRITTGLVVTVGLVLVAPAIELFVATMLNV